MLNLGTYQGEKKEFIFTITDEEGNTIDLTDKNAYMKITTAMPPASASVVATIEASEKYANGICKITIEKSITENIPAGIYYYEILVDFGDTPYIAEQGLFHVFARVEGETKTFATPEEVKMKLRMNETDFSNEEIQYFLEQAHRKVLAECSPFQYYFSGGNYPEEIKTYPLPHGAILKLLRVVHNGKIVPEENYSVDYDNGIIIFKNNYQINVADILIFHYIPYLYKDLEICYAILDILKQAYIQTAGEIINTRIEEVKEEINLLKRQLNLLAVNSWVDYSYWGRGFFYGYKY